MTDTSNLGLPFIAAAQAQKHVTHNEALRILDSLVQLAVLDRDLNAPPGAPNDGERWIVQASPTPTGAWAGKGSQIAAWQDGGWQFHAPKPGWLAYAADESALLIWNGAAWVDFLATVTVLQNVALLGVGTTADATNPFSAKLNNALWVAKTVAEGGDGNLRYKLSKESAANTLSYLFQDNFSGRAEIGLTGDDDFHFKVSPDGSTWFEGIRLDRATGKVSFPVSGGPREALAADRTYYVRSDGSDANDGLANNAGGAFLTVQKAINTVAQLDIGIYNVTIQLAAGTYNTTTTTNIAVVGAWLGTGTVTVLGDPATPSNVVLQTTTARVVSVQNGGRLTVNGCKLVSTSGELMFAQLANATGLNLEFGATTGNHVNAGILGFINLSSNYAISGGGATHWVTSQGGSIICVSKTITLTGTPNFSIAFALASLAGSMRVNGNTFSGAATGKRYDVQSNAAVNTGGVTLPGDAAGTTSTGGQYL